MFTYPYMSCFKYGLIFQKKKGPAFTRPFFIMNRIATNYLGATVVGDVTGVAPFEPEASPVPWTMREQSVSPSPVAVGPSA
jgi:hypothetical protein